MNRIAILNYCIGACIGVVVQMATLLVAIKILERKPSKGSEASHLLENPRSILFLMGITLALIVAIYGFWVTFLQPAFSLSMPKEIRCGDQLVLANWQDPGEKDELCGSDSRRYTLKGRVRNAPSHTPVEIRVDVENHGGWEKSREIKPLNDPATGEDGFFRTSFCLNEEKEKQIILSALSHGDEAFCTVTIAKQSSPKPKQDGIYFYGVWSVPTPEPTPVEKNPPPPPTPPPPSPPQPAGPKVLFCVHEQGQRICYESEQECDKIFSAIACQKERMDPGLSGFEKKEGWNAPIWLKDLSKP